mmetsp:Transcript_15764/g.22500  ORF Transcript_15764/g.22500 Transcript_15764/m.22500 type:complete len:328 (-) Transcript_15764:1200-2183(-)
MSNFLNLSTLSSARSRAADRFARLQDTPGGLLASFRSPSASAASGHSSLAPDGSGLPGGLSLDLGVGASGEFSALHVSGGGVGDLQLFEMSPDLLDTMCCGVVANGSTFCTLGSMKCSIKKHSRKVKVYPGELYISAGKTSAYSHHHAKADLLSTEQLNAVLLERHTLEEWVHLLHVLNNDGLSRSTTATSLTKSFNATMDVPVAVSAITPGRKRKDRYVSFQDELFGPDIKMQTTNFDMNESELVIIPSASSEDLPLEDKLTIMVDQWDAVVGALNKLTVLLKDFRAVVGDDIDILDERVTSVDGRIGNKGRSQRIYRVRYCLGWT